MTDTPRKTGSLSICRSKTPSVTNRILVAFEQTRSSRIWFAETFASQPRDHWAQLFDGTDACVGPVLTMEESAAHPHHAARGSFLDDGPAPAAAPAPRFSRTPGAVQPNRDGAAMLAAWRAGSNA